MYLKKLVLNNFRSFGQSEIPLCKDLTILVGENNGGKSNAIDAIRLLTAPLGGRRELYCEATDIRFGSANRRFELSATFTELNPAQRGRMISAATDAVISGCILGLKYDESAGRFPVPMLWGGHQHGSPEPGCHEMVRHVYLPPLRDAKRALASGNPTRIYALLNHFLEGGDPEAHLHPQLQAAVLSFLDEQAEKTRKLRAGHQGPASELQVIVATHSPNLSAWVESKKLIFFRSFLPVPAEAAPAAAEEGPQPLAGVPAEIMPEIAPNPVLPVS
ncbi:ATP-dependent nuclease [Bradyrhizobium sp. USDA 3315]